MITAKLLFLAAALSGPLDGCNKPMVQSASTIDSEVCLTFARQHWRATWTDEAIIQVKMYNAQLTAVCGKATVDRIIKAMQTGGPAPASLSK